MSCQGVEQVGNRLFYWDFSEVHNSVRISADGSRGPSLCFTMVLTPSTGAVKVKHHGGWKVTLHQLEWIMDKCYYYLRG